MKSLMAVPAYGRRYANPLDAMADWKAGRDFKVPGGTYFSIRDTRLLLNADWKQITLKIGPSSYVIIDLEEEPKMVVSQKEFLDAWALSIVSSPRYQNMAVKDAIEACRRGLGVQFKEAVDAVSQD